jgi:hypothetical protein
MKWYGINSAIANISKEVTRTKLGLQAYASMMAAPQMQAYAQTHRPWHDISGNAKEGLKAGTILSGNKIRIYLCHQVDYGVYLELAHDKKYAIIDPTIEHFVPEIKRNYQRIMRS